MDQSEKDASESRMGVSKWPASEPLLPIKQLQIHPHTILRAASENISPVLELRKQAAFSATSVSHTLSQEPNFYFVFFFFLFVLTEIWLVYNVKFQVYSKVIQLHMYVYLCISESSPLSIITRY